MIRPRSESERKVDEEKQIERKTVRQRDFLEI